MTYTGQAVGGQGTALPAAGTLGGATPVVVGPQAVQLPTTTASGASTYTIANIADGSVAVTLGPDQTMQSNATFTLQPNAVLSWPAGTLWAMCSTTTTLYVSPGLQNYAGSVAGGVNATVTNGVFESGTVAPGHTFPTVTVPLQATWRSLYVLLTQGDVGLNAVGVQSGIFYPEFQIPPLSQTLVRVPLFSGIDQEVTVTINGAAGNATVFWAIGYELDITDISLTPKPGVPLPVTQAGGLYHAAVSVATATFGAFTLHPSKAGFAYALKRWVVDYPGGVFPTAGNVVLEDASPASSIYDEIGYQDLPTGKDLGGVLLQSGTLGVYNNSGETLSAHVYYDQLVTPEPN